MNTKMVRNIFFVVIACAALVPASLAYATDAYDPCDYTWCYPQHDNAEYGDPNTTNENGNSNANANENVNINQNEIYITVYSNGSVTGTGIDARSLPSCNNALDDDEDGRIDYNDSDCVASGRENGKNVRLNKATPTFVSTAPTNAREGVTYVYDADARDSDSDVLTYTLIQYPMGMSIESSTGVMRWTPSASQANFAHGVTVAVSDGKYQATQSFQIFVERIVRAVTQPVEPVQGRVAGASIVSAAEASSKSTLRAYNIRIDTDEDGNSVVSWDATKPSRGQVLFGRASQSDRAGTDFTGIHQYEFATPSTPEMATSHRVVLGQLEPERVYYFRVISVVGADTVVSSERSFVQLGDGSTFGDDAGFASVISTLGSFLFSSWFLFLMIIIVTLILVFRRRNQQEILTHAPVEMHVGGGHH